MAVRKIAPEFIVPEQDLATDEELKKLITLRDFYLATADNGKRLNGRLRCDSS